MTLETATYIDDLTPANPVGDDNVSQGDDHIRLVKNVLKATFPGTTRPKYIEGARVDLASSTTPDLSTPATDYINVTGTTQIEGFATEPAGFKRMLRFAEALKLKYNATSLILPTAADIDTEADDHALAISLGSGNWQIVTYMRKSGKPLAVIIPDASETVAGLVEKATDAEIRAFTAGTKALMAEDLETAAAYVSIAPSGGTVNLDWNTFINGKAVVAANIFIANPTNAKPGTYRCVVLEGNDGTNRSVSFGNQFFGDLPDISDVRNDRRYELTIKCISAGWFSASYKRIS